MIKAQRIIRIAPSSIQTHRYGAGKLAGSERGGQAGGGGKLIGRFGMRSLRAKATWKKVGASRI